MGNNSSSTQTVAPTAKGLNEVATLYEALDAKAFAPVVQRWRAVHGNRAMHVNAIHPLTGNVQRAYFLSFLDGGKMLVRWCQHFMEEPYMETTDVVMTLSPAPDVHNPYIPMIQNPSYPLPIYGIHTEVELYDRAQGIWAPVLILSIEQYYYMVKPMDVVKYQKKLAEYQDSATSQTALQERARLMNTLSRTQRLRLLEQEQRQKEQKLFELKIECVKHEDDPVYIPKNSANLRPVYRVDPVMERFKDQFRLGKGDIFDLGLLLQSGRATDYFPEGLYVKMKGKNKSDGWTTGVLYANGRLSELEDLLSLDVDPNAYITEAERAKRKQEELLEQQKNAAAADDSEDEDDESEMMDGNGNTFTIFQQGFHSKDDAQREFCEAHIMNWRDAAALLHHHRSASWEKVLEIRNRMRTFVPPPSNGQSLYMCISHQLFGSVDNWRFIRAACCRHISQHREYYQNLVDIEFDYYIRIRNLAIENDDNLQYPDHLDIQAVCELFDCVCEVYSPLKYKEAMVSLVEPYLTFYGAVNEQRSRERKLPVISLSYLGKYEWTSVYEVTAPRPLRAQGGLVLGQNPSVHHVILNARKEISDTARGFTVVRYCGFMVLEQAGSTTDHIRAVFMQAQRTVTEEGDMVTFTTNGISLRVGEAARLALERIGIIRQLKVRDQQGVVKTVSHVPGFRQGTNSTRVDFVVEGEVEHVNVVLKAMEEYSHNQCRYYNILTAHADTEVFYET